MMKRVGLSIAILTSLVSMAGALDRPLDGRKLLVKWDTSGADTATKKLVFVSRDPAVLAPALGSADDPLLGSPGGAIIDVVFGNVGAFHRVVAADAGAPGWVSKSGVRTVFSYGNKVLQRGDDVARIVIKEGRALKVVLQGVANDPFILDQPLGSVGIRVVTGHLASCTLFDGATVLRDEVGRFVARNALGSAVTDCNVTTLGGPTCVDQSGGVCGGECPSGSLCVPGGFDACVCTAPGPTDQCGGVFGMCGGTCLDPSHVCSELYFDDGSTTFLDCSCGIDAPCEAGGTTCPPGFACDVFNVTCIPV